MFVSNKNSIFIVYACICVAGFAGLVALSSQETPINLSIAVVGLYGFFSTSVVFYLINKLKDEQDNVLENHQDTLESVWRHFDKIESELLNQIGEVRREMHNLNNNDYSSTKIINKKN